VNNGQGAKDSNGNNGFVNEIQKILTCNGACAREVVVDKEEELLFYYKNQGLIWKNLQFFHATLCCLSVL